MPTYFGCHPRGVFPLIYTGESCSYIVYTAGTSGSLKRQYATLVGIRAEIFVPSYNRIKLYQNQKRSQVSTYLKI